MNVTDADVLLLTGTNGVKHRTHGLWHRRPADWNAKNVNCREHRMLYDIAISRSHIIQPLSWGALVVKRTIRSAYRHLCNPNIVNPRHSSPPRTIKRRMHDDLDELAFAARRHDNAPCHGCATFRSSRERQIDQNCLVGDQAGQDQPWPIDPVWRNTAGNRCQSVCSWR
jgi:hypothetical protein